MVMLFGLLKADENAAITSWSFCNSEATVPQSNAQAGIPKAVPVVIDDAVGGFAAFSREGGFSEGNYF